MTDDLSQLLDRAADDAMWEPPPPSADLERARDGLAQARRRRLGVVVAVSAAAAVAAAAVIVIGVGAARDAGGPDSGEIADEPETTLLDYSDRRDGVGVEIKDPADVDRLEGAPADFTDFIVDVLARATASCAEVDDAEGIVNVEHVRTGEDGVAIGGVGGCGGYVALWAVVDGRWQEVEGTQEAMGCGVLRRYDVPGSFVEGQCVDYRGDHEVHPYP